LSHGQVGLKKFPDTKTQTNSNYNNNSNNNNNSNRQITEVRLNKDNKDKKSI
jgi:hypothetical protein